MATLTLDLMTGTDQAETAKAIQLAGTGKSVAPAAAEMFLKGLDLLNCGEPAEAAVHLERALETSPQFADGHIALGIAYAVVGNVYPAFDHLEKAVELEPANFYGQFKLGQLCFKLRLPEKGYARTKKALDCAGSLTERKLVAELLREERQRETSGLRRPQFNRPFSARTLAWGALLALACIVALIVHVA